MKLTEKQKQQIVDENVDIVKRVILNAELVNKGMYCHGINSLVYQLKVRVKRKMKFDTDEFNKMNELKLKLAGLLYLNKNKL